MEFCPKCGKLLLPSRVEGETVLRCSKCGFQKGLDRETYLVRSLGDRKPKREVVVVEPEQEFTPLPKTNATCPRCGNREAYWWLLQTRSADEPSTRFYRCTKCSKTWREY
ncbi:MAG: transcription factor S [Methanobacteriota archaeon]|nr:MAG: transcription factor S [Euryarchaeota archaeon]